MTDDEIIGKRIAQEIKSGDIINLGIGLPTLAALFIPPGMEVIIQSENGILGLGPPAQGDEGDRDLIDAGGRQVTIRNGGSFFDTLMSFSMIRGGHVDITVLGALEVDEEGSLANWTLPGKVGPGIGGAMDLTYGVPNVIVAMKHLSKDGKPKIRKRCSIPLTARGKVKKIITEKAVISITEMGLRLDELCPGISLEEVVCATEATLYISPDLKTMAL